MLLAFHNNPKVQKKYLSRVRAHKAADEIVQGQYWYEGKGCAVGCTLHSSNHAAFETELGVPIRLAYLEDRLFELMTVDDSKWWPEAFLSAIPLGADLSGVWARWAVWMLTDPEHGVLQYAKTERSKVAIQRVSDLWHDGGTAEDFHVASADVAAYVAAYASAAYAAAAAAAAYAAYADAAADADWRASRGKWAKVAAEKLIELMRTTTAS